MLRSFFIGFHVKIDKTSVFNYNGSFFSVSMLNILRNFKSFFWSFQYIENGFYNILRLVIVSPKYLKGLSRIREHFKKLSISFFIVVFVLTSVPLYWALKDLYEFPWAECHHLWKVSKGKLFGIDTLSNYYTYKYSIIFELRGLYNTFIKNPSDMNFDDLEKYCKNIHCGNAGGISKIMNDLNAFIDNEIPSYINHQSSVRNILKNTSCKIGFKEVDLNSIDVDNMTIGQINYIIDLYIKIEDSLEDEFSIKSFLDQVIESRDIDNSTEINVENNGINNNANAGTSRNSCIKNFIIQDEHVTFNTLISQKKETTIPTENGTFVKLPTSYMGYLEYSFIHKTNGFKKFDRTIHLIDFIKLASLDTNTPIIKNEEDELSKENVYVIDEHDIMMYNNTGVSIIIELSESTKLIVG
ncbi:hypothetical protein BJ944DRAFT_227248 [Cunninghamella echinulata]|nr:hypothetical protein BJ944DRAFT_227248 [Cunninghamella echinulata]